MSILSISRGLTQHHICTPLCIFKKNKLQPSYYTCQVSNTVHICTEEGCTYQYQLDDDLDEMEHTPHTIKPEKWYCPLSKQWLFHKRPILSSSSNNRKRKRNESESWKPPVWIDQELCHYVESFLDTHPHHNQLDFSTGHQQHIDAHVIAKEESVYYTFVKNIDSTVQAIFKETEVLKELKETEQIATMQYIVDLSCRLYVRMIQTDWYKDVKNKVSCQQYNEFYHVLMVLYNMKKPDGLLIFYEPLHHQDKGEKNSPYEMVIPHLNVMKKFPDEKTLKCAFAHVRVSESSTVSNQMIQHRSKKKTPKSLTDGLLVQTLHPIDNHQFTLARHLFHGCLTEYVHTLYSQSMPQRWID